MDKLECNLCSGKKFTTQFRYSEYDLLRCDTCNLGVLHPMPSIIADEYYSEDYYQGTLDEGSGFNVLDSNSLVGGRRNMAEKINWILSKRDVDSFLDIGCGVGLLVEAAHRQGLKAKGVDVSDFAINYGEKELGIQGLMAGSFQDVLQEEQFDIIYLNHVLEHVADPSHFLASCKKYLKPKGWLVLEVPDIDSTEAKKEGKGWMYILSEHLYYFNKVTLSKMVEKQGLKVRFVEKEVGSPGLLHSTFADEKAAKDFYDKWLKNALAQFFIRWVRKVFAHKAQSRKVDYKFIKVVAEYDQRS